MTVLIFHVQVQGSGHRHAGLDRSVGPPVSVNDEIRDIEVISAAMGSGEIHEDSSIRSFTASSEERKWK
jgi:hypothetical protein